MNGDEFTGRTTCRPQAGEVVAPARPEGGQIGELEMYRLILDSIFNGMMVTDPQGYITHFNKPYGQFLGVNPQEQIGRHCSEVLENTRMHIVAQTGRAEINQSQRIKGQSMVVQRIPIKKDGKVIAVFGQVMFKDVRDVRKLARKLSVLESKVKLYEQELISLRSTRYTLESIVGVSQGILALKREAARAAAGALPVLITGESGTGKELFAQAIHSAGPRRTRPFVRINCAAIPKDLLESELFGYETGAFTGARSEGKPGKFELAQGGSVFLDEIGDLPMEMQPKLLRVLEEKEFERVGGTTVIKADFRLVAASNQNLEQMMAQGAFRKDLYYRLNVIPIQIPPLRERPEDILALIRHYLPLASDKSQAESIRMDQGAEHILLNYNWPGNVRELFNVTERILHSLEGEVITPRDLPLYLSRNCRKEAQPNRSSLKEVVARAERDAINYALGLTGGNKSDAAHLLGIHRTLLYKKLWKYEKMSLDIPMRSSL
ncbi:MAG: sigma 54-interacting transcriptional regulator [Proteobacteria bacterium]|nr:sigma 54-interacting transcriptional regulator [Pseudomonadota bacterium]MBU1451351.1 sigma 54-interacting transcriptional regulator [Pseudomonadota bacterium]MBU2469528.1 sigma 54-interacting transcriptional regulator [Pseudomonadota bacterium]MBU2518385.1 sigma 54-interacting transcriptional regulator [Pseudomonadota bacterium]